METAPVRRYDVRPSRWGAGRIEFEKIGPNSPEKRTEGERIMHDDRPHRSRGAWATTAFLAAAFVAALASASASALASASAPIAFGVSRVDAAEEARAVLARKCGECHGPDLVKPKGKFGHVTDLARLAADPMFVVPGDPDDSELYLVMIESDPEFRMPPLSAEAGPLTEEEIEAVRSWIAQGAPTPAATGDAPGDEPPAGLVPEGPPGGEDAPAGEEPPTGSESVPGEAAAGETAAGEAVPGETEGVEGTDDEAEPTGLLGLPLDLLVRAAKFHPLVLHFPIGLLLAAALAELFVLVFRAAGLAGTVRFCLWLGALGAIVAAALGWLAGEYEGYKGESLEWHRWAGVATAGLALFTAIVNEATRKGGRGLYRFFLLLTVLAVIAAGHYGGMLVHGNPFPFELPFGPKS